MSNINKIGTILLFIWLQMKGNFAVDAAEDRKILLSAGVLFRHGDRNPLSAYPTDLWKHERWPGGYAALTDIGKQQEYNLGQFLRKRYESILGHHSKGHVYVRSTNIDRTLLSAKWCLNGIFQRTDRQWNKNIPFEPFAIRTVPKANDYLLGMAKDCPRYNKEMESYKNTPAFENLLKKSEPTFRYLSKNSGQRVKSFEQMYYLYDILYIENLKRKMLPKWTKKILVPGGEVEKNAIMGIQLRTNTTLLARLKAGFFIREILANFEHRISRKDGGTPIHTLHLYSAHDTTITDVLNSLGMFDGRKVSYAASLHFELYEWRNEHFIEILYNNDRNNGLQSLHIPQWGIGCPLGEFQKIYKEIIPTGSYAEECRV